MLKKTLAAFALLTVTVVGADVPACNAAYAQSCCKVCKAGKACGNSCISRDKTCHQPPGCACNG